MDRYRHQARFEPFGPDGQEALARALVTVVGVGALGSAVAEMLTRAGLGRLRLVDRDLVEIGNLHRQSLYDEADASESSPKAVAAAAHLGRLREDVEVEAHVADLDGATALDLLRDSDLVIDGTDNFEARHVLNEACLELDLPWVHGACLGSLAVAWPIVPGRGGCYACLVPDVPAPGEVETCESAGVISPAVHVAAAAQVAEAMKLLAGRHEHLLDGPWTLDVWTGTSAQVRAERDANCRACVHRDWRFLGRRRSGDWVACGRDAVQVRPTGLAGEADLELLAQTLAGRVSVRQNRFLLRFEAGREQVTVFRDGRVLVSGTRDVGRARAIVAQYLGG